MKPLNAYKNKPTLHVLMDGGIVVGEEVDENNQLHYIVNRGGVLTREKVSGSGNWPVFSTPPSGRKTIMIDTSQKTE